MKKGESVVWWCGWSRCLSAVHLCADWTAAVFQSNFGLKQLYTKSKASVMVQVQILHLNTVFRYWNFNFLGGFLHYIVSGET